MMGKILNHLHFQFKEIFKTPRKLLKIRPYVFGSFQLKKKHLPMRQLASGERKYCDTLNESTYVVKLYNSFRQENIPFFFLIKIQRKNSKRNETNNRKFKKSNEYSGKI